MYTPISNFGFIVPVAGIDLTIHTLLGIDWMLLLPYTVFGVVMMTYSQGKLLRGEWMLRRDADDATAKK